MQGDGALRDSGLLLGVEIYHKEKYNTTLEDVRNWNIQVPGSLSYSIHSQELPYLEEQIRGWGRCEVRGAQCAL